MQHEVDIANYGWRTGRSARIGSQHNPGLGDACIVIMHRCN